MSTIKAINIQHPSSANTNIVMDANGNMTVAGVVSTGSPMSGMRNRIINGAMEISQRGTTFASPATRSYTIDRWVTGGSSVPTTNTTISQVTVTDLPGFTNALRYQRNSGVTNTGYVYLYTIIESVNCQDLSGQTVTLSFYARTGANFGTNSFGNYVITGTTADEGVAKLDGGTWAGYTLGSSYTPTLSTSWQRFSRTITIGSGVKEIGIEFFGNYTGTAGAADYFDITGVQLESGTVATPFERRMYGQELALCQRYYHSTLNSPNGYKVGWMGIGSGNYAIHGVSTFPVPMRTNPTITAYAYGLGAGTAQELDGRANVLAKYTFNVGNSYQSHTYGLTPIATHNAIIAFNCGDNSTQGATYTCGYTASAEL